MYCLIYYNDCCPTRQPSWPNLPLGGPLATMDYYTALRALAPAGDLNYSSWHPMYHLFQAVEEAVQDQWPGKHVFLPTPTLNPFWVPLWHETAQNWCRNWGQPP